MRVLRFFSLAAVVLVLAAAPGALLAQAREVAFDLKLTGGKVAPAMQLIRVKQGDAVKLRWTSDRPITVHLHGYDIEKKVAPGAVTEMTFEARATGRFVVEEHTPDPKGGHAHGHAALLRVEVLPR